MAVTLAPEAHVRKRQYQPSIDSFYFHARDAPTSSAPERARSPMSPPLPFETQSSLLSVGMRVRKSVPEGYKTHKTMGLQESTSFPSSAPVRKIERTARSMPAKELIPFCGLHKIGGWGAQEIPFSSAFAGMCGKVDEDVDEDDMPGLSMSQCTLPSTQSSFEANNLAFRSNGRKRTYEDEVEDDLDTFFNGRDDEPPTQLAHRPIAKLKQLTKQCGHDVVVWVAGDHDFEDAMFLAPEEGMEVSEL